MSPLRSMVNVYVFYASGFVEWSVFALIAHNYYYICPKISQRPRFNVYVCLAMFAFICAPFCSNWFNAFHLTNCSRSRSLIQRRSKNEPFKHNSYPRPLTKKRNNQERTEQKKRKWIPNCSLGLGAMVCRCTQAHSVFISFYASSVATETVRFSYTPDTN